MLLHVLPSGRFVTVLALVLMAPALAQEEPSDERARERPSFILILTDDQGWTGTSVQMDDRVPDSRSDFYRTPAVERLAREGMRFSAAYAPHPNCSPSRASIQTGKSPAQLHMTDIIGVTADSKRYATFYAGHPLEPPLPRSEGLPRETTTLAEHLKSIDPAYRTAHFGKWHLGSGGPGEHGYDVHDGNRGTEPRDLSPDNPKDVFGVTERAEAFLKEQADSGAPFYLQVSHYAVHLPVRAREATIKACRERPPGEHHDHAEHAAMTEDLDAAVGRLLDTVDELGLGERTYVFYFSDNGANLHTGMTSNAPLAKGKASVYEGGMRVPFIARGPGVRAGTFCHQPVIGWDLFPTIDQLAGGSEPLPHGIEGASIVSLLEKGDEGQVARDALVFHFPHYQDKKGIIPQSALRVGDLKLIHFYGSGRGDELYDLSKDLGEEHDLSGKMPEKTSELRERLLAYLESIGAGLPRPNPDYDSRSDREGK